MIEPLTTRLRGSPAPSRFHVAVAELDGDEVVYALLPLAPFVLLVGAVALLARSVREGRGLRLVWGKASR